MKNKNRLDHPDSDEAAPPYPGSFRRAPRTDSAMTPSAVQVVGAAALLVPTVAVVAPLGLVPLLAVGTLVALVARFRAQRRPHWHAMPVAVLLCCIAVLGALSALWSITPGASLVRSAQLLAIFACGWILVDAARILDAEDRRRVGNLVVAGLVLALVVLVVERVADFPLRRLAGQAPDDPILLMIPYKRALTVIALVVWPAALVLWRRRRGHAAGLLTGTFAVMMVYDSGSARVALLLGFSIAAAAMLAPQITARALAAVLILYIATAPLLHGRVLDPGLMTIEMETPGQPDDRLLPGSGYHRLLIWKFTSDRIAERPVLGWGLDGSRTVPGGTVEYDGSGQAMPLHPHNAVLQMWLELGLGGVVLLGILVGWMFGRISGAGWPRADRAAALAFAGSLATVMCLSYGLWQSWWLAAIFLTASLTVSQIGRPSPRSAPSGN